MQRAQIVDIHEDVGADLQLGEDMRRRIEVEGAGAGAADDRDGDAGVAQPRDHAAQPIELRQGAAAALVATGNVLEIAGVGLNAAKHDAVRRHRGACQGDERRLVGAAGATVTGGEIDEHVERFAGPARRSAERREIVGMIDDDAQSVMRLRMERDEARDLGLGHLRRGDVHAGECPPATMISASPKRRAADAERAGLDLQLGDARRFMRLGMRAQRHADGARMRRHRRDVALERVAIDEQRRRVERGAAAGLVDEAGIGAEVGHVPIIVAKHAPCNSSLRPSTGSG